MKKWLIALSLLSFTHPSFACTAVNVTAKDGTVIAGRTMEWALEMKWQLNSIPAGTAFQLSAPAALNLPSVPQKKIRVGGHFPLNHSRTRDLA